MMERVLNVTNPRFAVFFVLALLLALMSCFSDVLRDESDSAPSEEARKNLAMKPTLLNRAIAVLVFLGFAAFSLWKMYEK
jgi:Na+-transporting methylmalonyl-CoA/oxaloacetate decarboxylase gamma subunit